MMRILFCNIAWMKEYRGNEDGKDTPLNGGSYVDETGDAHEKYNFTPVNMEGREGLYCLGFFETKSHNGKDVNQMRIENIAGCELLKKEESVDDVLVVYCAKHPAHKFTTVVGWYKHATVFRHYQALLAVGPEAAVKKIEDAVASNMQDWGKRYPHAGYGGCFRHWLKENNPKPYGSYGNGSAMRVSAVGWLYDSMERTREVARATANVTHNHPEGIKGAESTASAIYMARNGSSKEEIKAYIEREFHYDLSRTLDNIRTYYHHVESCQETVPEAIIAFLESKDFEDAIRNAVSLGGDTDTLGAITGSIAEAFYGIPAVLIAECKSRIDKGLMTDVLDEFDHVLGRSVDTYSDEVDETQANQMIEAAIDQYYIQQDKNGMLLFMEVMVTRMQQAGEVIVPYITENPFMSEEQISKVKAGDTISLDHDVRLKIETVKDADEKEWIGVFTSSEEMHKGSAGNVQMNQSIESILRLALNWEQVNGIVINPFGKYIQMTKKMIELLINGYEYNENERKSKDDENN